MLDICKYNKASQHDSTTQVLYLRLREPYISYTKVRVSRPNIQVIQSYKHMRKQISLSTDSSKKEGLSKPVYLHRALHGQDHHLGGKLLIDVNVYEEPIIRGCSVFCKM